MSTVTISVFAVVIMIFVLNIILEHLFNWWFRAWADGQEIIGLPVILYVVKTAVLIGILNIIL